MLNLNLFKSKVFGMQEAAKESLMGSFYEMLSGHN